MRPGLVVVGRQVSGRELRQLKWLTALVPDTVVLIYEFALQEALEYILPALPSHRREHIPDRQHPRGNASMICKMRKRMPDPVILTSHDLPIKRPW